MGVVYEAEQVSLGRRVALKVLPFAATLDPRHLQRFHNEARAAGGLHHTNIVPVYSVGCERGVHFYAMQFIDGRPLSDLIRQLRQSEQDRHGSPRDEEAPASKDRTTAYPGPAGEATPAGATVQAAGDDTPLTSEGRRGRAYYRRVAELGAQAAEALDHAHQVGIVHRDVKPANLLLGSDGRLWVTDFGLAHVQQGEASLTLSGDLVGTLRYMSPEQALAKRVVIDHRTDVYSLGATLYELLTLRPVFGGSDRQELLRQIAFEEPVRPRRLERAVPAELETVVLKALEKNPADRYATVQELADDLRRWLDDKPIRARRPPLRQMAARWGRRHRAFVWAAAAVLLVAAVLGGGAWLSWVQRRADARAALQEANRLLEQERWPEALSAARRAKEVLAGVGADAGLRWQAEELSKDLEMAQRLQEARLQGTAEKDGHFDWEGASAAYAEAFRWYGLDADSLDPREAGERIRARPTHRQLVTALDRWAVDGKAAGRRDGEWAAAAARAADPDEWRDRLRDAGGRSDGQAVAALLASAPGDELSSVISWALPSLRHKGVTVSERAISLLRQAPERHPDDFWANHQLAQHLRFFRPPRQEEAIRYYTAAVALRPQSPGARNNLGNALRDRGDLDGAITQYRQAIHLKAEYVDAHANLGIALEDKGLLDEAVAEYREAIRLKPGFHNAHHNLGKALGEKGLLDEAIAEYRAAIQLEPDNANSHNNLGLVLKKKGLLNEAIAEHRAAIRLKKDVAESHNNLGVALFDKDDLDGAIAEFREAIRLEKDYAFAHMNLGTALGKKGLLDEAMAEFREAIRLKPDLAEAHNKLGASLGIKGDFDGAIAQIRTALRLKPDLADAHYNLGMALGFKGQLNEAVAEYREAIRLKDDYAEAHCNLGHILMQQGRVRDALKAFRRGHELGSGMPRWPYPSAQWVRRAEQLAELDDRLPAVLEGKAQPKDAAERLDFAMLCCGSRKRYAAAARFFDEAFANQPALAVDLQAHHRYNSACAAALAGWGQGQDAAGLGEKERARLRQQALDWLRADLGAWRLLLDKNPDKSQPAVARTMQHWLADPDFATVRGAALGKLAEAERQQWQQLWGEVEALKRRATSSAAVKRPASP
jgi:tetratricopeptide (TPR) repeat protein